MLDCCFAAEAARSFQGKMDQAVKAKATEVMEGAASDRGVALLCAASARNPARLDTSASYTMFGRELVRALTAGDPHIRGALSLRQLCALIRRGLEETSGEDAPLPEVHVPDQHGGDLATVPLFPNRARHVDSSAVSQLREATADPQAWKRIGALHLVERLLGSVRESIRDEAQKALLELVSDSDREVARKARELWHQRGLGDLPDQPDERHQESSTRPSTGQPAVGIDFGTTNSAIGFSSLTRRDVSRRRASWH